MRRTLILTALGATTLSIGLGAGSMLASANSAAAHPTVTTTMMDNGNRGQMHDRTGMTQMMGSTAMSSAMDADDMNAMHTTMHAAMSDGMSAEQLAACDSSHTRMTAGKSSSVPAMPNAEHTAHHQGTKP